MLLTRVMCSCKFYVTLNTNTENYRFTLARSSFLISFNRLLHSKVMYFRVDSVNKKAFVASHCERVSCG